MSETTVQVMPGTVQKNGTLADGNAVQVSCGGLTIPCTVWATAVSGDTVSVSYSRDGGASYHALSPASVSSGYQEWGIVAPITDLQFQRTAGSGTTSTYGVS